MTLTIDHPRTVERARMFPEVAEALPLGNAIAVPVTSGVARTAVAAFARGGMGRDHPTARA